MHRSYPVTQLPSERGSLLNRWCLLEVGRVYLREKLSAAPSRYVCSPVPHYPHHMPGHSVSVPTCRTASASALPEFSCPLSQGGATLRGLEGTLPTSAALLFGLLWLVWPLLRAAVKCLRLGRTQSGLCDSPSEERREGKRRGEEGREGKRRE